MKRLVAMAVVVGLVLAGCAPRATPTPTPKSVTPPAITHTLVGRSQCLLCHLTGVASSPAAPEYHRGLENAVCLVCHKPSARVVEATAQPTPPGTPSPTPSPGPTPTATATPSPSGPSSTPHTLVGRENCLACHGSGLPTIPQTPPDHQGRANATCTQCHLPK